MKRCFSGILVFLMLLLAQKSVLIASSNDAVSSTNVGSPPPFVSSSLARQIVGTWEGSRHRETYLPDGRYGLDVDTVGTSLGRWRLAGNTLTIFWEGDVSTYNRVSVNGTRLAFDFRGRHFVLQRVK